MQRSVPVFSSRCIGTGTVIVVRGGERCISVAEFDADGSSPLHRSDAHRCDAGAVVRGEPRPVASGAVHTAFAMS